MFARCFLFFFTALAALCCAGCARDLIPLSPSNRVPVVRFVASAPPRVEAEGFVHTLRWEADDPDGRVVHYLVARNPDSIELDGATWTRHGESSLALPVHRVSVENTSAIVAGADPFEVIAVRAVDDRGAVSEPITRALFGENIAPSVQITSPPPRFLLTPIFPPTIRLRWEGEDADAENGQPAYYKYRLFDCAASELPCALIASNPDSLRRLYAPAFAGWDSVPGNVRDVVLSNLTPGRLYFFAITAFDDGGAYDPVFSMAKNLLRFKVGVPITGAPLLQVWSDLFTYFQATPRYDPDPAKDFVVDVPAGTTIDIRWSGRTFAGITDMIGYRWALDPASLEGGPVRYNDSDRRLHHWTDVSLAHTSAKLGPFDTPNADRDHRLFIEARAEFGYKGLVVIRLRPVRPRFDRDLLIVDDTRLAPDGPITRLGPPAGPWPGAAELDTFLFARGGVPWRRYPVGTQSKPGLFSGFLFDTLGTRDGAPKPTVPLEVLSRYRHVVWIVDPVGATYLGQGNDLREPLTALRYMSQLNRANTLAAYVRQGGKLWLVGGGVARACLDDWDYTGNNVVTRVYCAATGDSFPSSYPEIAPESFMAEHAGWRSCITVVKPAASIERVGDARDGLPVRLALKTPGSDQPPPLRTFADFYPGSVTVEYISTPNVVTGGATPTSNGSFDALDTLYAARAVGLPGDPAVNACMTVLRDKGGGEVLFTGFDLWSFQRSQCRALVESVLRRRWGIVPVMAEVATRTQ